MNATVTRKTLKPPGQRTCEDYAFGVRIIAGYSFAKMFRDLFWQCPVILEGEGPDGTDLTFVTYDEWMEANQLTQIITPADGNEFVEHVQTCPSPDCAEAWARFRAIQNLFGSPGPMGGEGFAIVAAVQRSGSDPIRLARKNGFGEGIDQVKPFFLWFLKNPDDWVAV